MFENFEFISVEKEIYIANNQGSEIIEHGSQFIIIIYSLLVSE